jgi:hypothetical protein
LGRRQLKEDQKLLSLFFRRPAIFTSKKKYLFVLSHMRSYSTLLAHILGSNEEVSGYSEINQRYRGWCDLMRLRYKVYLANNDQLSGRFVLDKILHNRYYISDSIFNRNDVHIILMLRNPEDTLKSIINMQTRAANTEKRIPHIDLERVLGYYIRRLKQLEKYGFSKRSQTLYLDSENLLEDISRALEFLTEQLHLKQKLQKTYSTFKYTGIYLHGDTSERIKEGKINLQKNIYSNIQIPKETLRQAEEVYRECRNNLLSCCINIGAPFSPVWGG